jgi:hypothetical protein
VSNVGFKGPFLPAADLQAKKPIELRSVNLFCVKKTLHDAVVKAYGDWPHTHHAGGARIRRLAAAGGGSGGAWAEWLESHAAGARA